MATDVHALVGSAPPVPVLTVTASGTHSFESLGVPTDRDITVELQAGGGGGAGGMTSGAHRGGGGGGGGGYMVAKLSRGQWTSAANVVISADTGDGGATPEGSGNNGANCSITSGAGPAFKSLGVAGGQGGDPSGTALGGGLFQFGSGMVIQAQREGGAGQAPVTSPSITGAGGAGGASGGPGRGKGAAGPATGGAGGNGPLGGGGGGGAGNLVGAAGAGGNGGGVRVNIWW